MKYEIYYYADVPKIVIKIVSNFFENEIKEYDYYSIITENILIDKIKYENTMESLYLLLKPLNRADVININNINNIYINENLNFDLDFKKNKSLAKIVKEYQLDYIYKQMSSGMFGWYSK